MANQIPHDLEPQHESLLDDKLPPTLSWSETVALIGQIGEVRPHGSDEFVFTVGTQRAFFKKPHGKDLGVEETARLRTFLKNAGSLPQNSTRSQPHRMVVVIDHHGAHVYRDFENTRPDEGKTIHPYDPFGFHHHLLHRKEAHYKGDHVPEENSFYEAISESLMHADEIVLIGHGKGKSSAVDFLNTYLKKHHNGLFQRVKALETADLSALTDPQLEAIARSHMIVGV